MLSKISNRRHYFAKFESSQQAVQTKHVFLRYSVIAGKQESPHNLQISFCLAENDVFCRKTCEILDPFSSFPDFLAESCVFCKKTILV